MAGLVAEKGAMPEDEQRKIQENILEIEKNLEPRDIIGKLFSENIIEYTDKETISKEHSRKDRVRLLIDILYNRGRKAYGAFVASLRSEGYRALANRLGAEDSETDESETEIVKKEVDALRIRVSNVETRMKKSRSRKNIDDLYKRMESIEQHLISSDDTREELIETRKKLEERDEELKKAREELDKLKNDVRNLERENNLLKEELETQVARVGQLEKDVQIGKVKRNELERKLCDVKDNQKTEMKAMKEEIMGQMLEQIKLETKKAVDDATKKERREKNDEVEVAILTVRKKTMSSKK